jgi:hypothetical protein
MPLNFYKTTNKKSPRIASLGFGTMDEKTLGVFVAGLVFLDFVVVVRFLGLSAFTMWRVLTDFAGLLLLLSKVLALVCVPLLWLGLVRFVCHNAGFKNEKIKNKITVSFFDPLPLLSGPGVSSPGPSTCRKFSRTRKRRLFLYGHNLQFSRPP